MTITDAELLQRLGSRPQPCAAGATVLRQGAPAYHVGYLARGSLRLLRHLEDGQALTMHSAASPGFFAEGALFSDVYHCDAVADTDCELHLIDKAALTALLAADPALSLHFLELVTRQLHRARCLAQLRSVRSAEERVLQHLRLTLPPGARSVTFPVPLMRVATELGLTHEVYYRALAKLARTGIITRQGRTIQFP